MAKQMPSIHGRNSYKPYKPGYPNTEHGPSAGKAGDTVNDHGRQAQGVTSGNAEHGFVGVYKGTDNGVSMFSSPTGGETDTFNVPGFQGTKEQVGKRMAVLPTADSKSGNLSSWDATAHVYDLDEGSDQDSYKHLPGFKS